MPHPSNGLLTVATSRTPDAGRVLTPDALAFVARLAAEFESTRQSLLERRRVRQADFDSGKLPDFPADTVSVRRDQWQVAPAPKDLEDRRVEITGPVERKMMINALNSGARVFMADFEDALSPTWENVVQGQANLQDAIRRTLTFTSPEGKAYRLADQVATLVVRPRGWHLDERHATLGNAPVRAVSASLFDFGLYFFHNARELIKRGSGPYFYLPKLESHLEARLWNDVFTFAERDLGIPHGTIRCTVLIETILGALEMEEILYELREHGPALNAGRWDYMFSIIKKFRNRAEMVLPDRVQVTMTVPFMRAYTELLVATCHRRGAHAIGGMAAFIPSRKDAEVNAKAIAKVTEDKDREAGDGFDGTWVAHPDLVAVARASFDKVLGNRPHQKDRMRDDVRTTGAQLVSLAIPGSSVTEAGLRTNVSVAVQYLASWLAGVGAAGINNLMEDAATAEISRAQLWQWIRHGTRLADGRAMSRELYSALRDDERKKLGTLPHLDAAVRLLDGLVLASDFTEFLTIPAYRELDRAQGG
jgi:malate synthase